MFIYFFKKFNVFIKEETIIFQYFSHKSIEIDHKINCAKLATFKIFPFVLTIKMLVNGMFNDSVVKLEFSL